MKTLTSYILSLITIMIMMALLPGCGTDSAQRVAILENAIQRGNQASADKGIDKAIKAGAIEIDKFALTMDSKQSHATKDMVDVIQGKAA